MAHSVENYKTCSFFGHAEVKNSQEVKKQLYGVIYKMIIDKNVGIFYFGGKGEFDYIGNLVVSQLKKEFGYLNRIYCAESEYAARKLKTVGEYDKTIYFDLHNVNWQRRIYFRNEKLVDISDYVIFFVERLESSGAGKIYKYALKTKKEYINLAKINTPH